MNIKIVFIFIVFVSLFIITAGTVTEIFANKLRNELIKDMAKMEYYQKEVNGNVLWIKDKK
jgi:cbb3-type cytochrome oxidase cytochrome c subunit